MTTITSAHLSIAADLTPGSVVVTVHGTLDFRSAASLQEVLDCILEDREVLAIRVDLHDVRGVEVGGVSGLAAAAVRADQRGAELTLSDPPEVLCRDLQSEGLTDLIRMGHRDGASTWSSNEVDRRLARRSHPSGGLHLVESSVESSGPATPGG